MNGLAYAKPAATTSAHSGHNRRGQPSLRPASREHAMQGVDHARTRVDVHTCMNRLAYGKREVNTRVIRRSAHVSLEHALQGVSHAWSVVAPPTHVNQGVDHARTGVDVRTCMNRYVYGKRAATTSAHSGHNRRIQPSPRRSMRCKVTATHGQRPPLPHIRVATTATAVAPPNHAMQEITPR